MCRCKRKLVKPTSKLESLRGFIRQRYRMRWSTIVTLHFWDMPVQMKSLFISKMVSVLKRSLKLKRTTKESLRLINSRKESRLLDHQRIVVTLGTVTLATCPHLCSPTSQVLLNQGSSKKKCRSPSTILQTCKISLP